MRENNGIPSEMDKKQQAAALAEGAKTGDQSTASDINQASEKNIAAGGAAAPGTVAANNAASNEDISPEGLLNVIS